MNFWNTPEWVKLKTSEIKTKKLLSRTEYLRLVGYKNYSETKYQQYLGAMRDQLNIITKKQ